MELKEFGEYFSEIRKREGFKSQRDLAEKSGISNATISRLEAGFTKPTPEVLRELANCFTNVTYELLMQNAGYLEIGNLIDEYHDVFELKNKLDKRYEDIIVLTKYVEISILRDKFNDVLVERGITIQTVIENVFKNFDLSTFRNKVLNRMLGVSLEDAIKFCQLYRVPFGRVFFMNATEESNIEPKELWAVTQQLDELIESERQERSLNRIKQIPLSNIEIVTKKQELMYNLSDNEVLFLYEQLNLFRKLKIKMKE